MAKIMVQNTEIRLTAVNQEDYLCLTDMIKAKDGDFFVTDWLRNRNTLEYIGIWEKVYNPHFNYGEFATIKSQAGLNTEADVLNMALFGMTAQDWRLANPEAKGNMRDYATINQLICLSNMENLNSVFINENMPQSERLLKLNKIAIQQMYILQNIESKKILKD